MTDFQMSLIAAGGVFVVGVISYNKWQEYKARKSVERAFSHDHDDVLMNGGSSERAEPHVQRHEPVLDGGPVPDHDVLIEPGIVAEPFQQCFLAAEIGFDGRHDGGEILDEDVVRLRLQGGDAGTQARPARAQGRASRERIGVGMMEMHDLPHSRR
ncbi:hypothetical protein ACEN88_10910 [Massilia sp. CT11-108]|uniref:hypothetical protein n=1 Tax=Massilia sp. CT11-108 TaxID=3393900 RepID=UPI0039A574E8